MEINPNHGGKAINIGLRLGIETRGSGLRLGIEARGSGLSLGIETIGALGLD